MNCHENQIFTTGFSLGATVAAAQTLPPGVYIVMNGCIFNPDTSRKNVTDHRSEEIG
jgi:L-asparaginase